MPNTMSVTSQCSGKIIFVLYILPGLWRHLRGRLSRRRSRKICWVLAGLWLGHGAIRGESPSDFGTNSALSDFHGHLRTCTIRTFCWSWNHIRSVLCYLSPVNYHASEFDALSFPDRIPAGSHCQCAGQSLALTSSAQR
ncbi:hypothetical protein GALMADRAFT_852989 [Galerina marginata CBS 339.88]|uniref:Uncharacterized protein n=1 Tax=Galerina marginata (strain CBS 339.88) TaxID=685588 RepID=A0A067TV16_GALM3|nr:hypothetical protein GALMADRAFT_852989 [Galerina marginata CBS 339.88]